MSDQSEAKTEAGKQPEIKTEELILVIDSIKWEQHHRSSYNGTTFQLFITERERLEESPGIFGEPAEYFASTEINGWDIYLHDTIPLEDRKRILFHEILEVNLLEQGFDRNHAHKLTLVEEEKVFGKRK